MPVGVEVGKTRSAREPFADDALAFRDTPSTRSYRGGGGGGGRKYDAAYAFGVNGIPEGDMEECRSRQAGEGRFQPGSDETCFPARPFKCLPIHARMCIPTTWQVIQDEVHLMLVFGTVCALGLLIAELVLVFQNGGSTLFHKELLCFVMILTNIGYLLRIISTYDESMRAREKSIASRKKDVSTEYEHLVEGIDEFLGKATQSSATLAESGFESKRRDFIRFLDRAEERAQQMVMTSEVDPDKLVGHFKAFVKHWLNVFAECSVDPINKPKYVLTDTELMKLRTIPEVARLVKERLRCTEVKFISQAHDQDVKMLRGFKQTYRRYSKPDVSKMAVTNSSKMAVTNSAKRPEIEMMQGNLRASQMEPDASTRTPRATCRSPSPGSSLGGHRQRARRCTWLSFGEYPCEFNGISQGGSSKTFACRCIRLVILSKEHAGLIFGLIIGVAVTFLVIFNNVDDKPRQFHWLLLPIWGYLSAVIVMLIRFEQLDIIQKLEHEIRELEREKEKLKERREEMVKFWSDMQQLTDIWVCRTTPRLDLLKEVHCSLEDVKKPELLYKALAETNSCLEDMEARLPELGLWRRNSMITEESKKMFATQVKAVYFRADQDLPTILSNVDKLTQDHIPKLRNSTMEDSL